MGVADFFGILVHINSGASVWHNGKVGRKDN